MEAVEGGRGIIDCVTRGRDDEFASVPAWSVGEVLWIWDDKDATIVSEVGETSRIRDVAAAVSTELGETLRNLVV